ncbi:MAG: SusC/RagA family TonB-linked outer membrane protein [Marinifilaceae bacterium]
MNQLKYFSILLMAMLLCVGAQAQTFLRGTVKDAKESLIGVNVVIMNKNDRVLTGVITDINGEYAIKMPVTSEELVVAFSFIGYKTKKVPYKNQERIDVLLDSDAKLLEEVTIQGTVERNSMGVSYKNSATTVERINVDVAETPAGSLEEALQGRLANVDIMSASGAPGSSMSIRIRGISSLSTSSEPLIVIDGIPYETEISEDFDFATATEEDLGALANISPADIANIEVLKDAAATAIWGSKGSNGVLLITTKQGSVGKMMFTLGNKTTMAFEPKGMEMLNGYEYVSLIQEELWNRGLETSFQAVNSMLNDDRLNFNPSYEYYREYNQNTDWLKEITQTGLVNQTDFSMSGGGERATYRFSAGYQTERGTTVGTSFDRLNTRLNLTYKFSNRFRVVTGLAFAQGNRERSWDGGIRNVAYRKMPNMSPYIMEEDGVTRTSAYFVPMQTDLQSLYNPIAMAKEATNRSVSRDINPKIELVLDITRNLKYTGTFGYNISTEDVHKFRPQSTGVTADKTVALYNQSVNNSALSTSMFMQNRLNYILNLNKHHIVGTFLMDINDRASRNRTTTTAGGASDELYAPGTGGMINGFGASSNASRSFGVVANVHYDYDNRYIMQLSYRRDGISKMNNTSRWGNFPSVSLAWRLDNEEFVKRANLFSTLKLYGSWGYNGKAPDTSYPYFGKYSTEDNYGSMGTVGPTSIQLNNLKWERVEKTNVGVDIAFLEDRLNFNADYYRNTTHDLLQRNISMPTHIGYTSIPYMNSGKMRNEGWEFRMSFNDMLKSRIWKVGVNFNISGNKNTILELPSNVDYMQYPDQIQNGQYAITIQPGDPMGAFYGFRYKGVYKDEDATYVRGANGQIINDISGQAAKMYHQDRRVRPGDAIYDDLNGDGIINKHDIIYLGNSMPKVTAGFGGNVGYKQLMLRVFFHSRWDYDVVNQARMNAENMDGYDNQSVSVRNRWRFEGDETNIPRALHKGAVHYNYLGSDRFVEDASFIRLKQLSLSYTLSKNALKSIGLSKLSFVATGYDLFTWTKYSGQDPEVDIRGGLGSDGKFQIMGVDHAKTPRPRKVMFGINVEF